LQIIFNGAASVRHRLFENGDGPNTARQPRRIILQADHVRNGSFFDRFDV